MPIWLKFALALSLVPLLLTFVNNSWRNERERDLIESDIRSSQLVMGDAVSRVLAQSADPEEVTKRLPMMIAAQGDQMVRWTPVSAVATLTLSAAERLLLARGEAVTGRKEAGRPSRIVSFFPVRDPKLNLLGVVQVTASLAAQDSFIVTMLERTALNTVVRTLLIALASILLGAWFVGRPTRALVEMARRIGRGDFSQPLVLKQSDEFDVLAREMNAMSRQLAEARDRVAHEAEARVAAIEQLRHSDRLATLGRLAAGISHELGTPLNVIAARTKMAQRAGGSNEVLESHLKTISEQAAHLTRIVQQVLDFARRRPPRRTLDDVGRLSRRAVEMLAPTALKQGITLRCEPLDSSLKAWVDSAQLQQVLVNVIMNGIQAMPSGGEIVVTLDTEKARPPDGLGADDSFLRIAVTDQGQGIAPDVLPRLFEPFFTTRGSGDGTGLGLSIAQDLVREHGGWMGVKSELNHGTCVSIYLPAAAGATAPGVTTANLGAAA